MEQSAEISSIDYSYDSGIPYDTKILWVQLKRSDIPPTLQVNRDARIISLDHNQGSSIKTVVVKDIMGTRIALELRERMETSGCVARDSYLLW